VRVIFRRAGPPQSAHVREKPVRRGAFIESSGCPLRRTLIPAMVISTKRRIEFHAGAARCGKDAAPMGWAGRQRRFHSGEVAMVSAIFTERGFCSAPRTSISITR